MINQKDIELLSNELGEIFFMDKSGKKLKGWNPLKMNDES